MSELSECVCARCQRDYSLREGCEPSKYCDACVHVVLDETEARLSVAEVRVAELDVRRREGRRLLARMVKYCREDKATTERATRLERLVGQVDDYLKRTHDPRDILRGDG